MFWRMPTRFNGWGDKKSRTTHTKDTGKDEGTNDCPRAASTLSFNHSLNCLIRCSSDSLHISKVSFFSATIKPSSP